MLLAFVPIQGASTVWDALEEEDATPRYPFTRSVGLAPGTMLGSPAANMEYLLGYRHGLLVEGSASLIGPSAGSWAFGGGYRFHLNLGLEGPFLGAFVRSAEVRSKIPFEEEKTRTYDLEASLVLVGFNLGYRWMGRKGWNVVARGGFGNPVESDFRWSPAEPENQDQKGLVEGLMGLDLEITMGYAF